MSPRCVRSTILSVIALTIIYLFILPSSHPNPGNSGCNPSQSLENSKPKDDHDNDPESVRKSFLTSQLSAAEQVYQRYVKKRRSLVKSNPSKVNPWPPAWVMYYWDYFLPSFICPHVIERIGGLGDGGKWVCGFNLYANPRSTDSLTKISPPPPLSKEPCLVYSFGVAHESSYEAEILKRSNCTVYAYDASVSEMGPQVKKTHPRAHFNSLFIGANNTNNSLTLKSLMVINDHDWIDFLKMDIEGSEVEVLNQIMDDFEEDLPFGQLQIELHTDDTGSNFPSVYKLWERMEEKGLRAFKNEVNHWPCVRVKMKPMYVEYSFINTKGNHRLIR